MQKLKDALHGKAVEIVLLLVAVPLTLLGGKLGGWLEKNILAGLTLQAAAQLLGALLGLLLVATAYILALLFRTSNTTKLLFWRGIEFRKGRNGVWMAFCPKCHVPLHLPDVSRQLLTCPANCGWGLGFNMDSQQVLEFMESLK